MQYNLIIYDVTSNCNSNCPMCFQQGNVFRNLTVDEIKESLKEVKNKEIRLLGGEPTLHPDLCEMIEVIHDSGNAAYISSNGILLSSNKELVKNLFFLQKSGKLTINISCSGGFSQETTYQMHGADELKMKLQALENLNGFKNLSASAIISKGVNEHVIDDLFEFQKKFNLRNITFRSELNAKIYYKTNEFLYLALKKKVITKKDLSKTIMAGFTDERCMGKNCCIKILKDGFTIHWYEFCVDCWRIGKYDPTTKSIIQYMEG